VGPILVVNAGSTSLKLSLVEADDATTSLQSLDEVGAASVAAVAHRVVHGGSRFRAPVVIDAEVEADIVALEPLAPLHNAPAVDGIERARRVLPDVVHVAVFDTAFHATIPEEASAYAIPRSWREDWGVRRYGFHGLSVQWCAERVPILLGRSADDLRLVICHLGGGCSVTAVRDGRSLDTTMGFSPLEGIPMTTRSGSLDPGAVLYLIRERGLDAAAILATDVFVHRLAGAAAAMAVAAGGLDALVFTAGIGENSALVRARTCERLAFLGVVLELSLNAVAQPDCNVAAESSAADVAVIHAREDLIAARAVRSLLDERR
jgi:acetate kinase